MMTEHHDEYAAGITRCEMHAAQCIAEAEKMMAQVATLYQEAGAWRVRAKRYAERMAGEEGRG